MSWDQLDENTREAGRTVARRQIAMVARREDVDGLDRQMYQVSIASPLARVAHRAVAEALIGGANTYNEFRTTPWQKAFHEFTYPTVDAENT